VLLNGHPVGIADGLFMVEPGTYELSVEKAGFTTDKRRVKVDEGQITRVEVKLQKS
jgi:hypothetical protein